MQFFYINRPVNKRDKNNNPIKPVPCITICYLKDEQGVLCRGMSLCSDRQEGGFSYRIGRNKARGRAMKAVVNRSDALPVKGIDGVTVLNRCGIHMFIQDGCFWMKSKYNVTLKDALNSEDYKIIAGLLEINVHENKFVCEA